MKKRPLSINAKLLAEQHVLQGVWRLYRKGVSQTKITLLDRNTLYKKSFLFLHQSHVQLNRGDQKYRF